MIIQNINKDKDNLLIFNIIRIKKYDSYRWCNFTKQQKNRNCFNFYIYGIGLTRSQQILKEAGVDPNIRTKDLTEEQANAT